MLCRFYLSTTPPPRFSECGNEDVKHSKVFSSYFCSKKYYHIFLINQTLGVFTLIIKTSYSNKLVLKDSPLANELVISREAALKAEKFPLQVVMCSKCSHFQLKQIVSPDRLFSNYVYKSGTSEFFKEHFRSLAKVISEINESKPLNVLEIGSNDGTLLTGFKKIKTREKLSLLSTKPFLSKTLSF